MINSANLQNKSAFGAAAQANPYREERAKKNRYTNEEVGSDVLSYAVKGIQNDIKAMKEDDYLDGLIKPYQQKADFLEKIAYSQGSKDLEIKEHLGEKLCTYA